MSRAVNKISPQLSEKIRTEYRKVATMHPTWSNAKVARNLSKKFHGISVSTVNRHAAGYAAARKKIRQSNPKFYKDRVVEQPRRSDTVSREAKSRVLKELLKLAANPDTGNEERFLLVELADLLM